MLDVVDLSRLQFCVNCVISLHFCTINIRFIFRSRDHGNHLCKTGKEVYKDMTKFWGKLFGINFALG